MEIERRQFQTYAEIAEFVADNPHCRIMKALRVCMTDGSIEDITSDVVEAAQQHEFGAHMGAAA